MIKNAILKKLKRKNREKGKEDRLEWALVSKSNPKKILRWFGPQKPSHEKVIQEEKRIHSFGSTNMGDNVIKDLITLADHLDNIGLIKEADFLEEVIKEAGKKNKKPSKKQLEVFDVDKDGKPFEKEDFKLLRKKSEAKMNNHLLLKELVTFANHLDSKGLVKEANFVDSLIKKAQAEKANVKTNYQVGRGDSWSRITSMYSPGRTPEENAALNRMSVTDVLQPCQVITIWTLPEAEGLANRPGCN